MRYLVYVDLDAFYVSCELVSRPELVGRPVIVGPDPNEGPSRGVVLSASYEARAKGVHSAQPVALAGRLCPEAVWIRADFPKYEHYSLRVREFLTSKGAAPVAFSIDEAAFGWEADTKEALEGVLRALQDDLALTVGLPASFGASVSLTVAKIATDRAKPKGVQVVDEPEIAEFLSPLPVEAIPGVGPKTTEMFRSHGLARIGDLRDGLPAGLRIRLGAWGEALVQLARGAPQDRELPADSGPRSRSVDRTFPENVRELDPLLDAARSSAHELAASLARERFQFQTVTIGLRWADFSRTQRSRTLPVPSNGSEALTHTAIRLLTELWSTEGAGREVRAISVRVERLQEIAGAQRSLDEFPPAAGDPDPTQS